MMNNEIKVVSIIGCGWLGLPLAKFFISKGYHVKGSTTTYSKLNQLEEDGIEPFLIQLNPDISGINFKKFFLTDLLIINIPPGRNLKSADYILKMKSLKDEIKTSAIKKVIFISSTSVYPEVNGKVDELFKLTKENTGNLNLFEAENLFVDDKQFETSIVRMAGLFGPERHPGRFFANKSQVPNGLSPINLIHLDDCIGIINAIVEQNYWNKILNAVCSHHPNKSDFYTQASYLYNGSVVSFVLEKGFFKWVESVVVGKILQYKFKHPDLIAALT